MLLAEFGTGQVLWSMLWFTLFFLWIWTVVIVFSDIFRSDDLSGWGKALWSLFVIFLPYLGVFVYLITQSRHMAERNVRDVQAAQSQLDDRIRSVAGGGAAAEIEKAKQLLDSGAITQAEYEAIKQKALA